MLTTFPQEEGVQFDFDGQEVSFRGTLTIFSADNLAAWAIGGYKALGSAFRKCQFCMVTDAEMQTQVMHAFGMCTCGTTQKYKYCLNFFSSLRQHFSYGPQKYTSLTVNLLMIHCVATWKPHTELSMTPY